MCGRVYDAVTSMVAPEDTVYRKDHEENLSELFGEYRNTMVKCLTLLHSESEHIGTHRNTSNTSSD